MRLTPENTEEIKIRFAKTETVEELAQLLSWIYDLKFPKRSEKINVIIEAKHLTYYAFQPTNRYKQFVIKKNLKHFVNPTLKKEKHGILQQAIENGCFLTIKTSLGLMRI